jgi:hypothetical protein
MLMFGCLDNIYALLEGPVTLKKDSRTYVLFRLAFELSEMNQINQINKTNQISQSTRWIRNLTESC